MAHNLARWTARIGMGDTVIITKTLRRRFYALAGRITLHLPRAGPSKIVRTADPVPTPPSAFDLSTMTPNAWAISTQAGPLTVLPASCAENRSQRRYHQPSTPPWRGIPATHLPSHRHQALASPIPGPSSSPDRRRFPSVDSANTMRKPFLQYS